MLRKHRPATGRSVYVMEWATGPDAVRGFGLRIFPTQATYIVRFRRKPYTIATIDLLTPQQARIEARSLLRRLRGLPDADAGTRGVSVADLLRRYRDEWSKIHKAPKTAKSDARYIKQMISIPVRLSARHDARVPFGDLDLRALTVDHVGDVHLSMRAKPVAANRALAVLSHALTMAEKWNLRPRGSNPVRDVTAYDETARERVFSIAEWGKIGAAIEKARDGRLVPEVQLLALEAIVHTGARPGEVVTWELDWLDHDRNAVRQARHKGARRGRRQKSKVVLLPPDLFERIVNLKRRSGAVYVFPGRKKGSHTDSSLRAAWGFVRAECGGLPGATLTTFRHSLVTEMPEAGVPQQYQPELAGHSSIETGQRVYMHASDGALRKSADALHAHITRRLAGEKADPQPASGSPTLGPRRVGSG